jgi:hypothetical protein
MQKENIFSGEPKSMLPLKAKLSIISKATKMCSQAQKKYFFLIKKGKIL